jgi:hypothetical protein
MSDWTQEWMDNELHTTEGGQPVGENMQQKMNGTIPDVAPVSNTTNTANTGDPVPTGTGTA